MADRGRDYWREDALRHYVLAGAVRFKTAVRGGDGAARWVGLLRRVDRGVAGSDRLYAVEEVSDLEGGGRAGTKHRAGLRVRAHRLSDEWMLLRPRVRSSVGDSISSAT